VLLLTFLISLTDGNFSDINSKVLFESIIELGTNYQFIRTNRTAAE